MAVKLKELLFQNKSTRQTITKNIFWLSFSQIVSRLIRAGIIIYAARVLGAAEYGIFSYALGLAAFFTVFADIGIGAILTREAAQKPAERSEYFATSLFLKSLLLAGTALLIIFVAPHFSKIEAAKALIPLVAFLTIFDGLRDLSVAFLRAKEKMEFEALIIITMNLAITVFGFLILSRYATARALTFAYVASTGFGMLLAIFILRDEFKKIFASFRKNLVRPIMNAALPIAVISLVGAFMLNTDLIMLGWWRSAQEIGFYSAGQKIIQVLYTLPAILASALFPTMARFAAQKKDEEVGRITEKGLTSTLLIALPLALGGIILAKPIITLLYGREYLPAVNSFRVLTATLIIYFPSVLIPNLILAYNKQKKVVPFIAAGSASNIIFNTILIPPLGIIGASIATFFAQLTSNLPIWIMVRKIVHFQLLRNLKKIFAGVLLMGATNLILVASGAHVLLNIALSGSVYFLALFLFKEKLIMEGLAMLKKAKTS
ncbi:MAG: flippase [Patescibacteria group bacterium]